MTFRHEYAEPVPARESGRILKISSEGEIEYEVQQWKQIKCASSDTSIRIRCDGKTLKGMANIGRFQQKDNKEGLTVMQCVERWEQVLRDLGYNVEGFGTRFNRKVTEETGKGVNAAFPVLQGGSSVPRVDASHEILFDLPQESISGSSKLLEAGTFLTRIDLAGNFEVSDYSALNSAMMVRRIGQKLPSAGKYGATWGYDSKRSNWWKAKLYDKTAELEGKRRSQGGKTLARFEVQLGSEFLKREGLERAIKWKGDDMAQIIYGKFAAPVFRESVSVLDWSEIPDRLRAHALLWRDGVELRTHLTNGAYYRSRSKLLEYGIDIGTACNVMALARHCRIVEVAPVSALREAA